MWDQLVSAGCGPFGNAQDPEVVPCAVCGDLVQHVDKFAVEKEIVHKACFICAYCGCKLQVGHCAQELSFYNRYGPCWYCHLICAYRSVGEKEARLKENGVEVGKKWTRKPEHLAQVKQMTASSEAPAVPAMLQLHKTSEVVENKANVVEKANAEAGIEVELEPELVKPADEEINPVEGEKEVEMDTEEIVAPDKDPSAIVAESEVAAIGENVVDGASAVGQVQENEVDTKKHEKESHPPDMDDYANKYRLQMKKKK